MTRYVWEGSQVVSEYDGAGALLAEYIYCGSRMIAKSGGGTIQYFLNDRLSARVVLDASGNVSGLMAHLPFGSDFAASGTQEKHHFTSYERDAESGLDYAINRNHSPNVGRFQQADSYRPSGYLVNPQSWNRYAYVENDPLNYFDPSGLLKALVVIFRNSEYGYVTGIFVVVGPPDPEEDSSGDGTGRVTLFDVESAVKNLGKGCKKFFGGEKHIEEIASFAQGITSVELISSGANKTIPGLNKTFQEYWDGAGLGHRPVAMVVATRESGTYRTQPYIIVGPAYVIPMQFRDARDFFVRAYGMNLAKWQRDALVHEFMHIWTRKDDMDMAKLWKDQGADLGDISSPIKASGEIAEFLARDCKKKK